jgi:methylated-DNA-[protein]-cysteine S-methyltransferase
MTQYAIFETSIGWAGVAWAEKGLVGCYLPEADRETARRSFVRRYPGAAEAEPTAVVAHAIEEIRELLTGKAVDLRDVRVYEIARAIPPGKTLTYGEIAVKLGDKLLARDVGAALGQNPWPIVVPCHRVTAAGGKLGGFSARGGVNTKVKLLAIEGAEVLQPAPAKAKAQAAPQPSLFD